MSSTTRIKRRKKLLQVVCTFHRHSLYLCRSLSTSTCCLPAQTTVSSIRAKYVGCRSGKSCFCLVLCTFFSVIVLFYNYNFTTAYLRMTYKLRHDKKRPCTFLLKIASFVGRHFRLPRHTPSMSAQVPRPSRATEYAKNAKNRSLRE